VGLEVGSFEGFELCVAVHEANGDKKGRERSIGLVRFRERSQRREQYIKHSPVTPLDFQYLLCSGFHLQKTPACIRTGSYLGC